MYDRAERLIGFLFTAGDQFSISYNEEPISHVVTGHTHNNQDDVLEAMARTIAHLAVQLTITQLQLRGLGQVVGESGAVKAEDVLRQTDRLARTHAHSFVAENLGEALAGLVDVDALTAEIIRFLSVD